MLATSYLIGVAGAEIALRTHAPSVALAIDTTLLIACLHWAAFGSPDHEGFVVVLALIPLARLLNLALPLGVIGPAYWSAAVAAPTLVGVALAARGARYSARDIGLRITRGSFALSAVALPAGLATGLIDYAIVEPFPLISRPMISEAALPTVAILLSTGLVEELLFRGLLLRAARREFGRGIGLVYTTVLFAVVSADPWTASQLALVLGVGALLALTRWASGSVLPAAAYHGAFSVGLLLVAPFLPAR